MVVNLLKNGGVKKKVVHSYCIFFWANTSQMEVSNQPTQVRRFVVDPGYPFHDFRSFSFSSGVPLFDLFLSPCSSYWSDLKPPGSIQPHIQPTDLSLDIQPAALTEVRYLISWTPKISWIKNTQVHLSRYDWMSTAGVAFA